MYKFKSFILILCFCLTSFLTIKTSWAEIIQLKSGRNIQGPIFMRVNDYVKVDMGNGIVVTYYLDEIKNILADSKTSAEFEEYQTFLNQQLEQIKRMQKKPQKEQAVNVSLPVNSNINIKKVDHQIKDIESTIDNLDKDFPNEVQRLKEAVYLFFAEKARNIKLFFHALAKLASLKVVIENVLPSRMMLLVAASWVIACYPTMIFARKFKEKLYWMAWIPILQIYLLIKLAEKPLSWILYLFSPLLIVLVPFLFSVPYHMVWFFIGIFILLVNFLIVPTLLWCSIIRFMDQPAWLGVGTLIPIINVIVIDNFNRLLFQPKEQYSNRISPAFSRLELIVN